MLQSYLSFSGCIFWSLKTCPSHTLSERSRGALGFNLFNLLHPKRTGYEAYTRGTVLDSKNSLTQVSKYLLLETSTSIPTCGLEKLNFLKKKWQCGLSRCILKGTHPNKNKLIYIFILYIYCVYIYIFIYIIYIYVIYIHYIYISYKYIYTKNIARPLKGINFQVCQGLCFG